MEQQDWSSIISLLDDALVSFSSGLTDLEVEAAEQRFEFRFPDDLRSFLQTGMPVGWHFPDWRDLDNPELANSFGWPLHGCLFDVEHGFWLEEWGERPIALQDAFAIATAQLQNAPKLIPIFSHRYMPARPQAAGNPVFSVYQMDIIYYGFDLDDYLRHEFKLPGRKEWSATVRPIEFWDPERFEAIASK